MRQVYDSAGRLVEWWDGTTRTYTRYDATGAVVESRSFTAEEDADADAAVVAETERNNGDTLLNRARTALANNADFLALGNPNNAQAAAQVKALTRQVNALIRLRIGELSSIDDA